MISNHQDEVPVACAHGENINPFERLLGSDPILRISASGPEIRQPEKSLLRALRLREQNYLELKVRAFRKGILGYFESAARIGRTLGRVVHR